MEILRVKTGSREEFTEITREVERAVRENGWQDGVVFLFVPHTTAGIFINENADPSVSADIKAVAGCIVPEDCRYAHLEGNSPAHMKSVLFNQSLYLLVEGGKLLFGRWQGIYFAEFDGPRNREIFMKFIGNVHGRGGQ